MLTYTPFNAEHLFLLDLQPHQRWMRSSLDLGDSRSLETGNATTLWKDGTPVLCVGDALIWKNRAVLWSVFGALPTDEFLCAHRICQRLVDALPHRRVEAFVACAFEQGHRWVKALGMELECERMRAYDLNGEDCALYAKVRD